MRNVIMTTLAALFVAGSVSAAELGGSVGFEITENAAGKYVAETTLGFGITADTGVGVAFGGFDIETVDGGNLTIDGWQLGVSFGNTTLSFGDQGDIFVGGRMNFYGEDTLALPTTDVSLIVSHGAFSGLIGFEDITADIGDVRNIQAAATVEAGAVSVTGAIDYNRATTETTLGADVGYAVNQDVGVGAVLTYALDAKAFGYEGYATYNVATFFVNGDDNKAFQNIGAGVSQDFGGLNVYAETEYNVDSKNTRFGLGVAFSF
jgi:hypothetical protein